MSARKQLATCLGLLLALALLLAPTGAQAAFGIKSFDATTLSEDGTVDLQAGSHPYELKLNWVMNQDESGPDPEKYEPEGTLREFVLDLPAGMVGNPLAVPRCSAADFEGVSPHCSGDAQVGVALLHINGIEGSLVPIFNLTPPLGVPAMIGFSIANNNSFNEASLRPEDYGVRVSDITVPNKEIQTVEAKIWGLPALGAKAGEGHFDERFCANIAGCASEAPLAPFLSLPTSCGEPLRTTLSVSSVEEPDAFESKTALSESEGTPTGLDGCNALEFNPTISSQPTTNLADSPSGLNVTIHQPQDEAPEGLSTAHLKDVKVTLPAGMSLNPSAANGLGACTEAQIGYAPSEGKIRFSGEPQSCPNAAKVGTLEAKSPLVDHKLAGAIYLAQPFDNPFGSLLAIYLAVEDEQTGTIVKLAGRVTPDPTTGQLSARFTENPQLPIEDIETHFFGGARGTLKTPLACGKYTTTTTLTPWSTPEGADATPSDSFETSVAAAGSGACPKTEAQAPNNPAFTAGTLAPQAGAYSPFVLKLTRPDGSQQLTGIDATLPKGLTGKLAGIPYCSEAQLAVAKSREAPNLGAVEQSNPSCPLASEVGTVTVGAGAGITPLYVQGHAYLTGPYKGAPLSLAIITPAVAGPFDLGTVVVRTALHVDPETAQIHAVSDPLPSIIDGIPLDLRSIALNMARPEFTLNPTSCDPSAVTATASTLAAQSAALSSPFQVGGCSSLKFKPNLKISLKGATKRNKNPALKAVLTYPKGHYANIASAQVTLPHSEFLDQSHIGTICTRVQFAANQCPKASIYGYAKATTPLLDKPLQGPVYLRSSSHELPDLVAALNGQIDVVLAGKVDTGKGGGIRNTFQAIPDAPVSKFVLAMQGGDKGLLVNSENICRKPQRALVSYTAHNGKALEVRPLIANDCGKKAKKKRKGRH